MKKNKVESTVAAPNTEVEQKPVEEIAVEKPAAATVPKKTPVEKQEIPGPALDFLKRHPELKAVYINKFGGTFPEGTPATFVKDAVLYQNPYFK